MVKYTFRAICVAALCYTTSCTSPTESSPAEVEIEIAKTLTGLSAGVACAHPEASRIGARVLADGGNAVDAAVAMQWALAVCYPNAGNIGGGGFMVARSADGQVLTLDYRESAPAAAQRDFYLNADGNAVEGKSTDTHYAAGVPGTVRGLFAAHDSLGLLPMSELIEPAIALAEKGFPLTAKQAELFNRFRKTFKERNTSPLPFVAAENTWHPGDTLVQQTLAATLQRIAERGANEFYTGTTAEMTLREMDSRGAWFTAEDLTNYRVKWRSPQICEYDSIRIISMGPPSSGGVALCQLMGLFNIAGGDSLAHNSVAYIHHLTEMQRRVYADRATYLGDPDFYEVPTTGLTQRAYLENRWLDFNPQAATPSSDVKEGSPLVESMETTHISVIDAEGNAVAVTTTLNGNFGSKIAVTEAGYLLNNEMDDFSVKPGFPNMFGLTGGEANAVGPQKRMLSSMTPVIVEKNGSLMLVAGSPGGSTIITSVLQTVLNTAVYEMPLDEAIAAPKFHSQWLPDRISVEEDRFPADVTEALELMGHKIHHIETLGRVDAVMATPDGTVTAAGDPRADNSAAGFRK